MPRTRSQLPIANALTLLLAILALAGAAFVVAASSPGRVPTFVFAALWVALGIRIWVKWGWEERLSIPACFALAVLTLASGLGWI